MAQGPGYFTANAVRTVVFQRSEGAAWESGILLNEGSGGIITLAGEVPNGVWDYRDASLVAPVSILFQNGKLQLNFE